MKKNLLIVLLLILSVVLFGCSSETSIEEEANVVEQVYTIENNNYESLTATLSVASGDVTVDSTGSELFSSTVLSNIEDWFPVLNDLSHGTNGIVTLLQPDSDMSMPKFKDNKISQWDVLLNEDVLLFLNLSCGMGNNDINLQDTNLALFNYSIGVGDSNIDLNGNYENHISVDIATGLGTLDGDFSGTYEEALILNLDNGVGDLVLDLSGKYKSSAFVSINAGVGDLNIVIPKNSGVRVVLDSGVGNIEIDGESMTFGTNQSTQVYVNDAYDVNGNNISIIIDIGVGDVDITTR